MGKIQIPVIIHGVTGRMGQVALNALETIATKELARVDNDILEPVPIGVARNLDKLKIIALDKNMQFFSSLPQALEAAQKINPRQMVYHNTTATGIRKEIMLPSISMLDAKTTAVYMEKPIAANYRDGFEIVNALEQGHFRHGTVHHMLEAPGIRLARDLVPEIKPVSAQMVFGYEVAPGFGDKFDYCCQRPDFNWQLASSGGGIILDMCHESYLSSWLLGETERLSATARLIVPQRLSTDRTKTIQCDVEDFATIRREHASGVVNTSVWSWYRRINSEFGPLEITIEGERGTIIFGLYGLKVQWKETAPVLLWERAAANRKIQWRDYWQYPEVPERDPFAVELADFLEHLVTGEKYPKDAIHGLNVLGEVEALYESAATGGTPISRAQFWRYPKAVPPNWHPERLAGKLTEINNQVN